MHAVNSNIQLIIFITGRDISATKLYILQVLSQEREIPASENKITCLVNVGTHGQLALRCISLQIVNLQGYICIMIFIPCPCGAWRQMRRYDTSELIRTRSGHNAPLPKWALRSCTKVVVRGVTLDLA